jgi:hypothetical protein
LNCEPLAHWAGQLRTGDGSAYWTVKVPHELADLERQLRGLGWDITVMPTASPVLGERRKPDQGFARPAADS